MADRSFQKKLFHRAARCYSKLIEKYPQNPAHFNKRGQSHLEMRNFLNATEDFEEWRRLEPSSMSPLINLAKVKYKAREYLPAMDSENT